MSKTEMVTRRMLRREAVKSIATAAGGIFVAPFFNKGKYLRFAGSPIEYSARAIELVGRTTVIDMLSPFAISPSRTRELFAHPETLLRPTSSNFAARASAYFTSRLATAGPMPTPKACSFSDYGMGLSLITGEA